MHFLQLSWCKGTFDKTQFPKREGSCYSRLSGGGSLKPTVTDIEAHPQRGDLYSTSQKWHNDELQRTRPEWAHSCLWARREAPFTQATNGQRSKADRRLADVSGTSTSSKVGACCCKGASVSLLPTCSSRNVRLSFDALDDIWTPACKNVSSVGARDDACHQSNGNYILIVLHTRHAPALPWPASLHSTTTLAPHWAHGTKGTTNRGGCLDEQTHDPTDHCDAASSLL